MLHYPVGMLLILLVTVSKDYEEISESGDTTDMSKIELRRELAQHLWQVLLANSPSGS